MHFIRKIKKIIPLLLLSLCSQLSQAEELSPWRFNGFFTLGAVYNNDSDIAFSRDLGQPPPPNDFSLTQDSLLGLQASYRFSPQWQAVGQLVSKFRYDRTYDPELSWGFVNYQLSPEADVRVGRLGLDVFMAADSRDVGFSYLWARPLSDYYGLLNFSRFDGLDFTYQIPVGVDQVKLKAYAGTTDQGFPTGGGGQSDYAHSPIQGVIAEYLALDWKLRFGYASVHTKAQVAVISPLLSILRNSMLDQALALADELDFDGAHVDYYSVDFSADFNRWRWQTGLSYTRTDILTYPSVLAGYVSLGYRLDSWTPYTFWSFLNSSKEVRSSGLGATVDAQVTNLIEGAYSDQSTLGIGARFDVSDTTAVKVQLEKLQSDVAPAFSLWGVNEDEWDGDTLIFSLTLDHVF